MKKVLILCVVLFAFNQLKAQNGFHEHDGFYLSMSIGPFFGNLTDHVSGAGMPYTTEYSGTGGQFDFKIGGAISENLILHATLTDNYLPGPIQNLSQSGNSIEIKHSDNFSIDESLLGAGITYYLMPSNVFFSSTVGLGKFSIESSEESNKKSYSTRNGVSVQVKLGKEWWISKNWGFGIGLTYQKTNLNDEPGSGITESLDSNHFGILFNTTFN